MKGFPFGSALAGNGTLSGEDQLVDINGHGADDLHYDHLLLFDIVYYSRLTGICKVILQKFNLHNTGNWMCGGAEQPKKAFFQNPPIFFVETLV